MKITFISPANMEGGVRVVAIYAETLAGFGHDVQVFSVQNRKPTLRNQIRSLVRERRLARWTRILPSYFDEAPINHHVLAHSGPVSDSDLPDADVVIATWWETASWVAGLAAKKGAKVYFMQDYGAPGQQLDQVVPTWDLGLKMITISKWLADLVQQHRGEIDVATVMNSVDLDMFQAPARCKQSVPTVGFAYRQAKTKGMDIAISAINHARETVPDLRVIAYGSKPPMHDLPLPDGAIFHQRPDDSELAGIYSACDAWIFPSRREGFGLPILEAMACRTPVIAATAGAAPELVTAESGFLVPGGDVDAMAQAIVNVCRLADADWQRMSGAAYEKTVGYSWDDATRAFETELFRAVEAHPARDID